MNFTEAKGVGRSHAYFEGGPTKNGKVKDFFKKAFEGKRAEDGLPFDSGANVYSAK